MALHKTVVLNVVALTPSLIGSSTPRIKAFMDRGRMAHIDPVIPAVTGTTSATYTTGQPPSVHGAVANGWYFRDMDDIKLWRQSNKLVQAPKVWDVGKAEDLEFTAANLFWWYNMNSTVDYLITPRPMYPSDGRKIPDIYTKPMDLRDSLQAELGQFPLFNFWGPNATIRSARWIADAAKLTDQRLDPTLTLIYLPHLDYPLQKFGTDMHQLKKGLCLIDEVVGGLIDYYEGRGAKVMIVSDYGIQNVSWQVHINRLFRKRDWISYRMELGREMIDPGGSRVFAVSDHQVAHVYVNDHSLIDEVKALLASTDGIAEVLDEEGKQRYQLNHERAGELVALAERDSWFTYYYWLDDAKAPDYARTVDIHQKPGYDPAELFFDPEDKWVKPKAGFALLKGKLGFRRLMQTVPLDGRYVKGSHGVPTADPNDGPLLLSGSPVFLAGIYDSLYAMFVDEPTIREAFRTGRGVGWHEHNPCLFSGTERFFRTGYQAHLIREWLPSLDGVVAKLERGATVADVGCGHGASTILMAEAFPNSTFVGFDYHDASIARAREAAEEAGVAQRVRFEVAPAKDYPGQGYDLVTFFDCLHDMGDPVGAAAHVRETLAPDGTWMIVEPYAGDNLTENLNPVGRLYYAASTMLCTPASLSQEVGLGLGAQAGEARLRDVVTQGGFTRFRRATETPFNLILEARP